MCMYVRMPLRGCPNSSRTCETCLQHGPCDDLLPYLHLAFLMQAMALCLLASAGSVLHAGVVHVLPAAGKAPLNVMIMVGAAILPACISAALPE